MREIEDAVRRERHYHEPKRPSESKKRERHESSPDETLETERPRRPSHDCEQRI